LDANCSTEPPELLAGLRLLLEVRPLDLERDVVLDRPLEALDRLR
jgi:hypothetical protein